MLTKAENEMLTRVGPGTPMGQLLRRYWIPALISTELERPDGDPVRVRLLGENFVAFRDSAGKIGFLNEPCCHRGASLALGRVEDGGIRCIYHGWKFAVDGTILETPNISDSKVKDKIKAPAYPVREAGGLIWVYLGPKGQQPPVPNFHFMTVPDSHRSINRAIIDCNWVQVMEGGLDSSHVGILHADYNPFKKTASNSFDELLHSDDNFDTDDNAPSLEIENTDFGFHYAALRRPNGAGENILFARIHPFVMPWVTMVPPGFVVFYIPLDDEHTAYYLCFFDAKNPVDQRKLREMGGFDIPGAWDGDHLNATAANRWLQDRASLGESFTGLPGLNIEDFSVDISMGPIVDRTGEHLVPADVAVIRMRRMLLKAAKENLSGTDPVGLRPSSPETIQAGEGLVRSGDRWQDLVPGNAGVAVESLGKSLVSQE